ncbi:helix-turn-helix domain-containing protein [Demequina capsici]|uniref:Helix-turn-helix domain-containing protein n=1 Tax=Demequina capsici TaxID=3075620 RepID=A0AA96FDS8_9MICO|nr:helix-turn-helix domain-containing protein [Demequina sp. PMTSA13]WNM28293.1 helix-turn-helix domain-containing protein [Demequina sp. PMTSA13]
MTHGSPIDLADLADVLLTVARKMHAREMSNPDVEHLGVVETLVMRHVDRSPGTSPSEVANAVGLQPSNASAAIRSLTRRGLIERRRSRTDARGAELWPTEFAASNLERLKASWRTVLAPHVGDDVDIEAAFRLLDAVDQALKVPPTEASSR